MGDPSQLIVFGTLGRPHGLRGELNLRPFNDDGADLGELDLPVEVQAVQGDVRRTLSLASARPAGDVWLVAFAGIDDRDAAAALTNFELWLPRELLPPLDDNEVYIEDLVGCLVVDDQGREHGTVQGSFWNGAQDVLTVVGPSGQEVLVPVVPDFLLSVDLEARRVVVDLHE
jgi:16S rRNA processing protein RimM